jgi:hypothetical protein
MNSFCPRILITPTYSYYALLLGPDCYGRVYVFRILGVIIQL